MKNLPCIITTYTSLHLTLSTSVSGVKVNGKTSDDAFRSMDGDGGWGCFDVIINYVYRTIISCNVNSPVHCSVIAKSVVDSAVFPVQRRARDYFIFFFGNILYDTHVDIVWFLVSKRK